MFTLPVFAPVVPSTAHTATASLFVPSAPVLGALPPTVVGAPVAYAAVNGHKQNKQSSNREPPPEWEEVPIVTESDVMFSLDPISMTHHVMENVTPATLFFAQLMGQD